MQMIVYIICLQGILRELQSWSARASIVIVTKCPEIEFGTKRVRTRLKVTEYQIIFYINYDSYFVGDNCKINRDTLKGVKKVFFWLYCKA
jgi:hypothetical protein